MARPGNTNTLLDVAGLSVGQAEDEAVRTGVTVVLGEAPMACAVAVAGGGPGTRETDLLSAGSLVQAVDAVVLSGGSAFGLGAADGVADGLKATGRGFSLMPMPGVPPTPIVPAAILYDLANGGEKGWDVSPYPALGRTALQSAGQPLRLGRAGAGYGAKAGAHPGGIGSASIVTEDGITVAALAAVNCFGSVFMPGTDAFWAWPFEHEGEFGGARPPASYTADAEDWGAAKANPVLMQNTTIAVVATDAALSPGDCQRVATMAQAGFARAIRPVFAPFDGDCVFALSTAQRPLPEPASLTLARIGELAASVLARAIARGVYEAGTA